MVFARKTAVHQGFSDNLAETARQIGSAVKDWDVGTTTMINSAVVDATHYIQIHAGPEGRRAILILTDNLSTSYQLTDGQVIRELDKTDTVFNAIVTGHAIRPGPPSQGQYPDPGFTRPRTSSHVAEETGGDWVKAGDAGATFSAMIERIRTRYMLTYHAPESKPGTFRRITVTLSPDALKKYPGAESGPAADITHSRLKPEWISAAGHRGAGVGRAGSCRRANHRRIGKPGRVAPRSARHRLVCRIGVGYWICRAPLSARRSAEVCAASISPLDAIAVTGIAAIIAIVGFIAYLSPPNSADAMAYHMPRVIYWAEQASVRFFPTPYLNQIMLQPLAEYFMLHTYLLSGGDRFMNFVQWLGMAGSVVGVSLIARLLGAGARGQADRGSLLRHAAERDLAGLGREERLFAGHCGWRASAYFALRYVATNGSALTWRSVELRWRWPCSPRQRPICTSPGAPGRDSAARRAAIALGRPGTRGPVLGWSACCW